MAEWIYSNAVVEEHSLYQLCASTLNEVSNRDYPNCDYFNSAIACLDMDTYEKHILQKGQADRTVDAVIGIATYENNRGQDPRLLLIELRMEYENISNLSKTEMERKVTYTKSLLGGEKRIERDSLFVFNNQIASQAERWFAMQNRTGGELKHCRVRSVAGFSMLIKSISDFPYVPLHKEEDIKNSVQQFEEKAEWMNCLQQIEYWCRKAEGYRYKNPSEFKHIAMVIKNVWNAFKQQEYTFSNDEILEIEILEEDFEFLNRETA